MIGEFEHLIGKPFQEYGRGPDGYDCWGAVYESGRIMGEPTPDYHNLGHRNLRGILKAIRELTVLPEYELIEKPERRAIILFKVVDGRAHFGRMIDNEYFIHANQLLGVHISSIDGPYRQLVRGFYLWRKK